MKSVIMSGRPYAALDQKHKDTYEHLKAQGVSDPVLRRHMAAAYETQMAHVKNVKSNPLAYGQQFPTHAQLEAALREDTLSANIPTWTQTALPMVEQLFEGFFIQDVFSLGNMTQPTIYANTETIKAGTEVVDSEYFDDPDLLGLDVGLDVSYLDFNSECGYPNEIDYTIDQTLITAVRKGVAGDVGILAQQDAMTQFGVDILAKVQAAGALELQRELQGGAVAAALAAVSSSVTWTADPTAGSVYESLDPDVWARTLMKVAMTDVDVAMMEAKDIRAGWNRAIARPDVLARMLKVNTPAFDLAQPETDTNGQMVSYHNLFGTTKAMGRVLYQYEYVAADTILCVRKDPRFDVFTHLTYVPIESFGTFQDVKNGCTQFGMHTRFANYANRTGGLVSIVITPEAEVSV